METKRKRFSKMIYKLTTFGELWADLLKPRVSELLIFSYLARINIVSHSGLRQHLPI